MRDEITDKLNDVDEKVDLHDVNLDNMHRRMNEHDEIILNVEIHVYRG